MRIIHLSSKQKTEQQILLPLLNVFILEQNLKEFYFLQPRSFFLFFKWYMMEFKQENLVSAAPLDFLLLLELNTDSALNLLRTLMFGLDVCFPAPGPICILKVSIHPALGHLWTAVLRGG